MPNQRAADERHHCDVPRCDGTRLGHDLAVEFPDETARLDEAMRRIAHPDDYANPFRDDA